MFNQSQIRGSRKSFSKKGMNNQKVHYNHITSHNFTEILRKCLIASMSSSYKTMTKIKRLQRMVNYLRTNINQDSPWSFPREITSKSLRKLGKRWKFLALGYTYFLSIYVGHLSHNRKHSCKHHWSYISIFCHHQV